MPYGIQQPAISSQILQLEQDLGVKLFERKPFSLTLQGEVVYTYVRPFFEGLDQLAAQLRKNAAPLLRLGAAEFVLRDYLPLIIKRLKERFSDVHFGFRAGFSPELEQWLVEGEIDLAIMPSERRPPAGLRCEPLVKRKLALLVPSRSKYKSAEELWAQAQIAEPLIRLPAKETITRYFLKGLKQKGVEWPMAIEASSVGLIIDYVANEYGIGLAVHVPDMIKNAKVRILPLEDFDPISIVAMWRGQPSPVIQTVVTEAKALVAKRWPEA